jgi:hypothetical protein
MFNGKLSLAGSRARGTTSSDGERDNIAAMAGRIDNPSNRRFKHCHARCEITFDIKIVMPPAKMRMVVKQ